MSAPSLDIEARVNLSLAVRRYMRTKDQLESSSDEFGEACTALRDLLPVAGEFVVKSEYKHFLVRVEADRCGFEVKEIEVV